VGVLSALLGCGRGRSSWGCKGGGGAAIERRAREVKRVLATVVGIPGAAAHGARGECAREGQQGRAREEEWMRFQRLPGL
jgi:hypothetical protein